MRIPLIFSFYVGRHFLASIAIAMGIILSVTSLIDFVELIRRTANKTGVPFHAVIEMALMKVPFMAENILPYAVLIGAMMALTKLTRSQELIVARASGISVWQFIFPVLLLGVLLGIFVIIFFNPISAAMIARYEKLEDTYISGQTSTFTISSSGLWLRQVSDYESFDYSAGERQYILPEVFGSQVEEYILRANSIAREEDMTLSGITIFLYGKEHNFIARVDADSAKLMPKRWVISNARVSRPGEMTIFHEEYILPTDLNISQIQDSFADPRTLSFWQLTSFIETLENAGFSALRHKVHWHSALALPVLLCGMILIAAVFSLRLHRSGRVGIMIVGGIVAGFLINFTINLFHAFGYSGNLPVILASWAPPVIVLMLGVALLLHFEDG